MGGSTVYRRAMSEKNPIPLKCVIVGDGAVGKTCLVQWYTEKTFPQDYIPTVFDNKLLNMTVDDVHVSLELFDTAGQEDYKSLRLMSYPRTNIFVICYAVNNKTSLTNVQ